MSKEKEMLPSNVQSPPYDNFQDQPPAYGPPLPQHGYPSPGVPPQQGYPMAQPQYVYPGTAQHYQYGNVVVQQPHYVASPVGPPPPDHMTAAILATLFCFWPTGIIAIIRASDARAAVARGDIAGATSIAQSAKTMINISVIVGIIMMLMLSVIMGVYFGFVVKQLYNMDE